MVPQGKFTRSFASSEQFVCPVNADLNCHSSASLQAGEAWASTKRRNLGCFWFVFVLVLFLLQTLEVLVEKGKKVRSPIELSQETVFALSSCRVSPAGILCA